MESLNLLGMRTGASGAVGADCLSRKDSKIAGIIGAGRQGRLQLRFLTDVRPIEKVYVTDKIGKAAENFSKEMSKELEIDVVPLDNVEKVAKYSDILVTATPSMKPFIKGDWLNPGLHINIIGADDPPKIEIEGKALKKADKLVIMAEDSFLAGQIRIPLEKGEITKNDIYGTLGEIIAGVKSSRENDEEITVYHNPGMTLQDLAAGYKVYQKAKELGIGVEVPDPFKFT
jgi:alanine dehydrogenase